MIPGFDPKKHIKFIIDNTKVDSILQDFPILLNISEDSGINHYDCQDLFDELRSNQGEVTTNPPIAHWTMDTISGSTLIDEKGNYNGTITNMTQNNDGLFDKYLSGGSVSSTSRYVNVTSVPFKSISLWIQRINLSNYADILMDTSTNKVLAIQNQANDNFLYFFNNSAVKSDLKIEDKKWHHVVLIEGSDNNHHWIYLDNVKCSNELSSNFAGQFKYLGRNNSISNQEVVNFDNVQVFDYKLTTTEIKALYHAGFLNKKVAVEYVGYKDHYVSEPYTKLLIHSDTTDISTLFSDSSLSNHTLTAVNNTHHSSNQKKFGNTSIYFDGSGDILQASDNLSDWAFGTDDFTVDWWEYRTGTSRACASCSTKYSGSYRGLLAGHDDGDGTIAVYMSSTGTSWDLAYSKSLGSRSLNEWVHLAVVRKENSFYLFKNGIQTDSWTSSKALHDDAEEFTIGANQSGHFFQGYIDEFRISKGIARWTTDFTPPNKPYDNLMLQHAPSTQQCYVEIENWDHVNKSIQLWTKVPEIASEVPTALFLYYDKGADDNTDYVGDTSSTPAQKVWDDDFAAVYHMAQNPSTGGACILDSTTNTKHGTPHGNMTSSDLVDGLVGKALYFDGSDDYIKIPTPYDWNDQPFTIDIMANVNETTDIKMYFDNQNSNSSHRTFIAINHHTTGSCDVFVNTGSSSSYAESTTNVLNAYHLITARSDGSLREIMVDGVVEGTTNLSGDVSQAGDVVIAAGTGGSNYYIQGKFAETRISKISRSSNWIKATNYTLKDNLLTFKYELFTYSGYVQVEGAPAARKVYLYIRNPGLLVDKTISNGSDGSFSLSSPYNDYHFLTILPELSDDYNIIVKDKIHPEV